MGNVRAALFAKGQVINLNDRLKLLDRLTWTLAEATGINENGEISGWGVQADGELHAFKLTPRPHIDVSGAPRRGRHAVLGVEAQATPTLCANTISATHASQPTGVMTMPTR